MATNTPPIVLSSFGASLYCFTDGLLLTAGPRKSTGIWYVIQLLCPDCAWIDHSETAGSQPGSSDTLGPEETRQVTTE
jgi:hypothetical protein